MKVKLKTREIPAHSFVLAARTQDWSLQSLSDTKTLGSIHWAVRYYSTSFKILIVLLTFYNLDWTNLEVNVAETLLQWVYTDHVDLSGGDGHLLNLMRAASSFHLQDLVNKFVLNCYLK